MISWPVALHKQPSAQRLSSQAMLTESIEPGWEASPSHHCFGEVMQGKRLVTVVRTCEQTYETASWLSIFKSAIVGLDKYFGKAVPDTSVQSTQGLTSLLTPKAPDSFKVSRHWVCCITTKKEAFWKSLSTERFDEKKTVFYIVILLESTSLPWWSTFLVNNLMHLRHLQFSVRKWLSVNQ